MLSLDAVQGIPYLAHRYVNGVGVAFDVSRALELYERTIELGDVMPMV